MYFCIHGLKRSSTYLCMYVCIYVCLDVYMHVCVYVFTYVARQVDRWLGRYACKCVCLLTFQKRLEHLISSVLQLQESLKE